MDNQEMGLCCPWQQEFMFHYSSTAELWSLWATGLHFSAAVMRPSVVLSDQSDYSFHFCQAGCTMKATLWLAVTGNACTFLCMTSYTFSLGFAHFLINSSKNFMIWEERRILRAACRKHGKNKQKQWHWEIGEHIFFCYSADRGTWQSQGAQKSKHDIFF